MSKLAERTEPVVWSKGVHAPLPEEQLDDYERRGYLLVKDIFTEDEVDRLNERAQALADKRSENVIFEPEGENHLRFLLGIHHDDLFAKYARNRFILGVVRQILNSDVYIYQSKVVSKDAFFGKAVPFHTDYNTWHGVDGLPTLGIVNVSIFLTDQELFNGALMVVPGSHKYFLRLHERQLPDTDQKNFDYTDNFKRQRYDKIDHDDFRMIAEQKGFDYLTGRKGSVLFFDANIVHGSTDNISPFQRRKLLFTYSQITNKPANPVRPGFIVDRNHEIIR
uniref:Ectoine hydroxylase n=1 Tax=Candidatus Kentrum eta TaxID=2126337 RepID=A0A450VEW1_9GAMM|nr:MAG: ectoine hydroxylase [Candidatus Kentron sp. H]VFJ97840.1 MAG: ectoine hydroxylase [Candidatus Kentron sp. H]VFK03271.1 MAG: ectoine hydroxylase [Candidatus Kentron sp. H]